MTLPKGYVAVPMTERSALPGAVRAGKPDPDERIRVSVYVRRSAAARPIPPIDHVGRGLPRHRTALAPADLQAIFGADPADLDAVAAFAKEHRLSVVERSAAQRRVLVSGRAADLEAAFGVELHLYHHPRSPHRGHEGAVHVPAHLAGVVEGVFGLDDRKVGRSRAHIVRSPAGLSSFPPPGSLPANIYYPTQVAALYNYPPGDGEGQTIAVLVLNSAHHKGGYSRAALEKYFTRVLGQPMPSITDVVVHGPGNAPGRDDGKGDQDDSTDEIMLDLQTLGAVAPGAKIVVYFTVFTEQGWVDAVHAIASDTTNDPAILSCSFGNSESGPESAWSKGGIEKVNEAFQIASARHVTICVASGDDGSGDQMSDRRAHADFPASSPYALACGGTRLEASRGVVQREVAWHDRSGSSGGGVSAMFARPPWQEAIRMPSSTSASQSTGRGVPDVAGIADPDTGVVGISVDGVTQRVLGGTSVTAPLWAALVARLNQRLGKRVGYLNPFLYAHCATGVLRDVVSGDNGAYKAGRGWDAVTGLGSPDGGKLLEALRCVV